MNLRGVTDVHDRLNPRLWDGLTLKSDIRDKLLQIADAFMQFVKIKAQTQDIVLMGSSCNYNYSIKYSDIDLHLVLNLADPVLKELFDAKKKLWNIEHQIDINGSPVEVYAQDSNTKYVSDGVYSVQRDQWIQKPNPQVRLLPDAQLVMKKAEYLKSLIDQAMTEEDSASFQAARDKIWQFRQAGLDHGGEFSAENLAFKVIRRDGSLEKLIDLKKKKEDLELSV